MCDIFYAGHLNKHRKNLTISEAEATNINGWSGSSDSGTFTSFDGISLALIVSGKNDTDDIIN